VVIISETMRETELWLTSNKGRKQTFPRGEAEDSEASVS